MNNRQLKVHWQTEISFKKNVDQKLANSLLLVGEQSADSRLGELLCLFTYFTVNNNYYIKSLQFYHTWVTQSYSVQETHLLLQEFSLSELLVMVGSTHFPRVEWCKVCLQRNNNYYYFNSILQNKEKLKAEQFGCH